MNASVILENVTISYNRHPAVHHISGEFKEGSLTAIAGPNGAGKSTLLKAIAGIIHPQEGRITVHSQIAYLPQATDMQRDFPLSVLPMIASGFWGQTKGYKTITSAMQDKASQALVEVGLRGFEKRDLSSLSTGQFQRALFARLLVQDAQLMLLDEPFNAIDEHTTAHLMELILRWHQEKRTIICVLHDFEQIRKHFPECLLLARECVAWDSSVKALNPEKLLASRFFKDDWQSNMAICERAV